MARQLSKAQVNHLRRLLGWVRCEVGQSPDELVSTVKEIAGKIGPFSEYGKTAMVEAHAKSVAIPKYIRAAIKSLEPATKEIDGEIIDLGEMVSVKIYPAKRRMLGKNQPRIENK